MFDVQCVQHDRSRRRHFDGLFGWTFVVRAGGGWLKQLNWCEKWRNFGGPNCRRQLQIRVGVRRQRDGCRPVRGTGGDFDGRRFRRSSRYSRFGRFLCRRRGRHGWLFVRRRVIVAADGHVGRRVARQQHFFQIFEISLQRLHDLFDKQMHFVVQVLVDHQLRIGIRVCIVIAAGHVRFLLLRDRSQVHVRVAIWRERERVG